MKYGRLNPPEIVEETPDLIRLEDSYNESFNLFPRDGFLQDYYYYTLGWGANSLYSFWSAVAGLSGLASRDVHLKSAMNLFPNFYIFIVGPPGLGYKSTAMNEWDKIETEMWNFLPEHLVERKKVPIIRGKATPEFLFQLMKNRHLEHSEGMMSDAVLKIRVSELDNFLSKATYNQTLVSKLTDFYDCKEWDTDGVLGRNNGKLTEIQNIYATLLACTTPEALKSTLPAEAFGGGFLSRVTVVNADLEEATKRDIPWPFYPDDVPDKRDMAERLAWLATYKNGEYSFTQGGMEFYQRWFREVREKIIEKARKGDSDDRDNRITLQALKLATLISYQRYDLDKRITREDMWMAVNIIDYTLSRSVGVIDDVSMTFSSDRRIMRLYRHIKLAGPDGISQRDLMRKLSYKVQELDDIYKELRARDLVERYVVTQPHTGASGRKINTVMYKITDEPPDKDSKWIV